MACIPVRPPTEDCSSAGRRPPRSVGSGSAHCPERQRPVGEIRTRSPSAPGTRGLTAEKGQLRTRHCVHQKIAYAGQMRKGCAMPAVERMTITMPADMAKTLRQIAAKGDMPRPAKSCARPTATGRATVKPNCVILKPCGQRSRPDWIVGQASRQTKCSPRCATVAPAIPDRAPSGCPACRAC